MRQVKTNVREIYMVALRKRFKIVDPQSQQGAALVMAIMILLILTVLGIYAVTTSTLETKMAGSERAYKVAFYTADTGEPVGVNIIKEIILNAATSSSDLSAPWKDIVQDSSHLFSDNEIFTDGKRDIDSVTDAIPNVIASGSILGLPEKNNVELWMDIDRLSAYQMTGGATQFASGYEGIGSGGGGSIGVAYAIDSLGRYTLMGTQSRIEAGYRYVVGVPGGE
jgi:hypothetical protein